MENSVEGNFVTDVIDEMRNSQIDFIVLFNIV